VSTDATHNSPGRNPAETMATLEKISKARPQPTLCPNHCVHRTRQRIFRGALLGLVVLGLVALWVPDLSPSVAASRNAKAVFGGIFVVAFTLAPVGLAVGLLVRPVREFLGLDREHVRGYDEREKMISLHATRRTLDIMIIALLVTSMVLPMVGYDHDPVLYVITGFAMLGSAGPPILQRVLARRM